MNQIVVETTDAVLKEGPGTEFPQKKLSEKRTASDRLFKKESLASR